MYCNMQVKNKRSNLIFYKFLSIALLCLSMPFWTCASQQEASLWSKANTYYSQKRYDSAEAYYSQLLRKYPKNALLQYNMGNVSFRLNKVGKAVLHYQKAALLQPGNKDITDNLLLAKGRIQNPIPEAAPIFFVRWWNGLLQVFQPDTWAVLSLLTFGLVLALIWYARVKKEQFAHAGRWLSLAVVSLILCGCMTWFSYEAATNSGLAVILEPATTLLEEPRASGKVLGALPEGTVIEVYAEDGRFINVKLPNGREGWVLSSALGKV